MVMVFLIVMLMFTMVLVTIITTKMPIIAHLSVVCHQLVIEELDVFVFSHLALGLRIAEAVNFDRGKKTNIDKVSHIHVSQSFNRHVESCRQSF